MQTMMSIKENFSCNGCRIVWSRIKNRTNLREKITEYEVLTWELKVLLINIVSQARSEILSNIWISVRLERDEEWTRNFSFSFRTKIKRNYWNTLISHPLRVSTWNIAVAGDQNGNPRDFELIILKW